MAKEIQRTCKRCNTVWYLPIKAARERMPSRMLRTGIRMQAAGAEMSFGAKAKLAVRRNWRISRPRLNASVGTARAPIVEVLHSRRRRSRSEMARPEKLFEIRERHTLRKTGPHDDKSITLTVTPQRADAERLVIFFQNVETVRLVIEELQKEG